MSPRAAKKREQERRIRALRIKAHCDAAGLTPAEIEKRTGWHELRVWRLFAGKTSFTVEDLELLAGLLCKPVGELFSDPPKSEASA